VKRGVKELNNWKWIKTALCSESGLINETPRILLLVFLITGLSFLCIHFLKVTGVIHLTDYP